MENHTYNWKDINKKVKFYESVMELDITSN